MKRYRTVIWRRMLPLMVAALLTLALNSCTKESLPSDEQQGKEYIDFSLELTPPGAFSPAQSRAITVAQQNAIYTAQVLVFENNILLYHKMGIVTDIDGVKKQIKVYFRTWETKTELFDIMVIGNSPAAFSFADYVGKTKDELKAAFNVEVAEKWDAKEFVMYGEALQTLIKPVENNLSIQMLRSLARIDVGVGAYDEETDTWAGLTDFILTEVRVVNSRNKFAAIPSATTLNESGNVKVSVPTIPSDAVAQGKTAADAILYNGADITDGTHTASTIFIAEAPNTTDKVTLLIGGSYKGEGGPTTFYRVDMCVPKAGAPGSYDYLNILRNHLYRITITSVMGAGFTDAQEALNAPPMQIVVDMTATPEGGAGGEIMFDGNSYIMADVSSMAITTSPDGLKSYDLFNVKAGFTSGTIATVTGPGITTPIVLTDGVSKLVSVVLPASAISGDYVITVGRLTKRIKLLIPIKKSEEIDAHFDVLPYMNVASMTINNPQPWITLSHNMTYLPSEQQSANIVGNGQGKAYVHFDENIATSGAARTAEMLVKRVDGSMVIVTFTQRNLSGLVAGYFGGAMNDYAFTKQLAIESIDEHSTRVYDDTSIGSVSVVKAGMKWGFDGILTNTTDRINGLAGTISLARRNDSGVAAPYTIYNNYPARYCYDKNRDTNGNGSIDDSEVVWYLPAQNQLMGVWIGMSALTAFEYSGFSYGWSTTQDNTTSSWGTDLRSGYTYNLVKKDIYQVRCVREL